MILPDIVSQILYLMLSLKTKLNNLKYLFLSLCPSQQLFNYVGAELTLSVYMYLSSTMANKCDLMCLFYLKSQLLHIYKRATYS